MIRQSCLIRDLFLMKIERISHCLVFRDSCNNYFVKKKKKKREEFTESSESTEE